ncbi:hypothetical protein PG2023B_1543 [Bifidobacterium pseudolongum subsp. globosum]|nr:hypothetical protein PG2023B_1543 [Bifidobacterium pseudolongum subsp. globosum]
MSTVVREAWGEQVVHHEATYKTVHHDTVVENRTEFSNCRI